MAMSYGYVYVASVSMGANKKQLLDALHEAESYHGPSIILAYAPCISHGILNGMGKSLNEEKEAVESGYWLLYRYNPTLKEQGKNPLILDSKEPVMEIEDFLKGEIRFTSLMKQNPEEADRLFRQAKQEAQDRYQYYKRMAEAIQ